MSSGAPASLCRRARKRTRTIFSDSYVNLDTPLGSASRGKSRSRSSSSGKTHSETIKSQTRNRKLIERVRNFFEKEKEIPPQAPIPCALKRTSLATGYIREGARCSRLTTNKNSSQSISKSTLSSELNQLDKNAPHSGTDGSLFSRSKAMQNLSGSGFETSTTHMGYDGPSAMEILCGDTSVLSSNSYPFNREQDGQSPKTFYQNDPSGFQNMFDTPTNPTFGTDRDLTIFPQQTVDAQSLSNQNISLTINHKTDMQFFDNFNFNDIDSNNDNFLSCIFNSQEKSHCKRRKTNEHFLNFEQNISTSDNDFQNTSRNESVEVTPVYSGACEETVFRAPLPPRSVKRRASSSVNRCNGQDLFVTPERTKLHRTPDFKDVTPATPVAGPSRKDDMKTPKNPTPRRLAGLFSTPRSAFSSLPKANDYFLTPSIDTTPLTTIDESSSATTLVGSKTVGTKTKVTTSSETDNYYILAITEGRGTAVGEVGLACIDIMCPTIQLCQISDSQTYMKTLTKINVYNPAELIVPDTFLMAQNTSYLFKAVTDKFENMKVVTVKRVYFNDNNGFEMIKQLIQPELSSIEITIQKKYYALAAVYALVKYAEFQHNIVLPRKSIRVEYQCAKGVVYIDLETARRLELVTGNVSGTMADKCCLLAVVNKCKTLGGKRRLRTLLLQPPCHLSLITYRQEAVDFLVHDPVFLVSLQNQLSKLSDVEKLLWLCKKPPNFNKEQKTCENLTNFVLLLKKTVEEIPAFRDLLGDAQQEFFIIIRERLSDQRFDTMKEIIYKTINADAKPVRGYSAASMQRCFSIKEKVNDLLDVARVTYSNLITLVQEEIDKLSECHELPLKLTQSSNQGFHVMFSIPRNQLFMEENLPQIFIQVRIKGNSIKFTTKEIYCLNARISRTLEEIQLISNMILYEMVLELREHVGCLYRLCENISEMDVVCSLAQTSTTPGYIKPSFGTNLNLSSARHPILDMLHPTKPIPNSVFASRSHNVCIITGPNMSGKTIYVTMIPLIQIMSQLGCYVPAEKAEIRITNHIAVRKGDVDNMVNGMSSFAHEIKELIYIQQTMTTRSLIIADEIFQGANEESGTAMSWAYIEEFLTMPAFTFISTHYLYLTNLPNIFSNVSNFQLEVIERSTDKADDHGKLTFTHRVLPGPSTVKYYGLRLLSSANLPDQLKREIFQVAQQLKKQTDEAMPVANLIEADKLVQFNKIDKIESFMKNLYELVQSDNFTVEMAEGLQNMVLEEILTSDEESGDETGNIPSANGSSSGHSNEKRSNPSKSCSSERKSNFLSVLTSDISSDKNQRNLSNSVKDADYKVDDDQIDERNMSSQLQNNSNLPECIHLNSRNALNSRIATPRPKEFDQNLDTPMSIDPNFDRSNLLNSISRQEQLFQNTNKQNSDLYLLQLNNNTFREKKLVISNSRSNHPKSVSKVMPSCSTFVDFIPHSNCQTVDDQFQVKNLRPGVQGDVPLNQNIIFDRNFFESSNSSSQIRNVIPLNVMSQNADSNNVPNLYNKRNDFISGVGKQDLQSNAEFRDSLKASTVLSNQNLNYRPNSSLVSGIMRRDSDNFNQIRYNYETDGEYTLDSRYLSDQISEIGQNNNSIFEQNSQYLVVEKNSDYDSFSGQNSRYLFSPKQAPILSEQNSHRHSLSVQNLQHTPLFDHECNESQYESVSEENLQSSKQSSQLLMQQSHQYFHPITHQNNPEFK